MKCKKCGTRLTANTLSACPGCGKDRDEPDRRIWLFEDIMGFVIAGLVLAIVAVLFAIFH